MRHAPGLPFVDESEIGWKSLGQQDRSAFASAQTVARQLQGRVRFRVRIDPLDPVRPSHFLGAWKTTSRNRHFVMDLSRDDNSPIQVSEKAELVDAGKGYKR